MPAPDARVTADGGAVPDKLVVTSAVSVDMSEIEERFVRASGPGGQNVNKVSTAVELRFDVGRTSALAEDEKLRLARLAGRRMTADGVLVIRAQRFRTQGRNRIDALDRLAELIRAALVKPRKRIATRPTTASRLRRLDAKRRRSTLKRERGGQD